MRIDIIENESLYKDRINEEIATPLIMSIDIPSEYIGVEFCILDEIQP